MKDVISVIIPVHNGQEYIKDCVDSVLSQHNENYDLEILIVNDGSTDDTGVICEALRNNHQTVHVIALDDLGVSCGRNAGLDAAKGDFISFVDADDRLLPGAFAHMYGICKREDCDFAGCGFQMWHEGEYAELIRRQDDFTGITYQRYRGNEYLDKGILAGDSRCWGKLYRRASIGNIRFEEGLCIGEDMLFLLRVVARAKHIVISDYNGYGYYKNMAGLTLRPFDLGYMDQITCWQQAASEIEKLRPDLKHRAIANLIIAVMLTAGKIAMLPKKSWPEYRDKIKYCHEQLVAARKVPGAFHRLSFGYKIKVMIFTQMPGWYVRLYHFWKRVF